ncbi:MAG: HAD family phosphatase [Candidatus Heimdallarchaeota archaeon]|nr:HAD family phosphatase [Candidatus Heimdallarchaeota archaeon]
MNLEITMVSGEKKQMNVKGILFDLDGTLIDSLDLHIESFQWILERLGKTVPTDDLEKLMGLTPQDIIGKYFADLPREILLDAANIKENYLGMIIQQVYVYPGIALFLKKLGERGIKRVVISSTHKKLVKKLLEKADLLQYIDDIVSGDEVINGKPDPEPFLLGKNKLGLQVTEVIGIGDSIHDAESCRAGGISFLGILTGKTSREKFISHGFHDVISNIDGITIIENQD